MLEYLASSSLQFNLIEIEIISNDEVEVLFVNMSAIIFAFMGLVESKLNSSTALVLDFWDGKLLLEMNDWSEWIGLELFLLMLVFMFIIIVVIIIDVKLSMLSSLKLLLWYILLHDNLIQLNFLAILNNELSIVTD